MKRWIAELRALLALAIPGTLSTYCFFAISITELSVMGHLGVAQLAAVAYAQMALDLSTLVFMQGLNAGLNALCSQAFGARNYHLLGEYALLTLFALSLMCVPMGLLWWHLGDLLSLAGVAEPVVAYARAYARLSVLWLWPRNVFQVFSIFYQAQQIVLPTTLANALAVALNFVLALGLTHGKFGLPRLGFVGCPLGTALALWTRLVAYLLYMNAYKKLHRRCAWRWDWTFLDWRVFRNLVAVGLPLAAGNLFENAQLTTMALFASQIGEVQLGSHNSMMELFYFATSPIYGLINGAVTRIGVHLGAGEPGSARLVAQLSAAGIVVLTSANSAIIVGCRRDLGRIFSEDAAVIASFAQICSLAALAYLILAFFYYAIIVLQAQARPAAISVGFAAGAWLVGVPTAYYLGLARASPPQLLGIWLGMLCGYAVTSAIGFYVAFFRANWREAAARAVERSQLLKHKLGEPRDDDPLLLPQC
ncbi:hypothetical protein PybrP1_010859 [[Pythium] brassicae (nom. inval.)]|nr:hypothetical protein PybrP1_010859 [[Pythium] brassicae (nom. inval.)]